MLFQNFTKWEWLLWLVSVCLVTAAFLAFDQQNFLRLSASLIGVTALIFCSKGNPLGQFLIIIFSILYGVISYRFHYYGEMVTYLGMTAPMAVGALLSWLRHPYKGNAAEVEVAEISGKMVFGIVVLTGLVTGIFYLILGYFSTPNLGLSTLSVATSFVAVCLTFCRSPYYAVAYAANDGILIGLWVLAAREELSYLSVVVCFVMFFGNDVYGFWNWRRMQKRQQAKEFS